MSKKLLSIALVLVMIFSLGLTAFAADEEYPEGVAEAALSSAATSFEKNGVSEVLINAATVTSVETNSTLGTIGSYDVTVQAGFIYTYTCTVTYGSATGLYVTSSGEFTANDNIVMILLNSLYEFFLDIFSAVGGLFTV